MISIFVLDTPEFLPLVEHARNDDTLTVSGPVRGYFRLQAKGEIRLTRKALGFKPAVWHGALTGGMVGRIAQFDNDTLLLVEAGAGAAA